MKVTPHTHRHTHNNLLPPQLFLLQLLCNSDVESETRSARVESHKTKFSFEENLNDLITDTKREQNN